LVAVWWQFRHALLGYVAATFGREAFEGVPQDALDDLALRAAEMSNWEFFLHSLNCRPLPGAVVSRNKMKFAIFRTASARSIIMLINMARSHSKGDVVPEFRDG
jgi:hypothetical protein